MSDWRLMENVPKDDKQHILLLLGETIPDVPDIRVGTFLPGINAEELGYREYAKHGGWLIWNTDSDWFVVDVNEPNSWMPIPPPIEIDVATIAASTNAVE